MDKYYAPLPTEKQIEFADVIADVLEIDFPTCSAEFTKWAYQQFISNHIHEYKAIAYSDDPADDDEMAWWDPHAESGY